MCFSATASFSAAAVLGTIGAVSLKKISRPEQAPFAAIPLLFALQQVSEGMLWLSLSHESLYGLKTTATYVFLFFAQFLWTWWIPFAFYRMEHNTLRKQLLFGIFFIGLCCSSMLGYRLIIYDVYAGIENHHIRYDIGSTYLLSILSTVFYIVAIIVPFFISTIPRLRLLGIMLIISLLATRFLYENYLISVWCFFAALLSFTIIHVLNQANKRAEALSEARV